METISISERVARKDHNCNWCHEKINKGEKYQYQVCKDDEIYIFKNHIKCEKIAQKLHMFDEGGLSDYEFIESINEEYNDIMSKNYEEIWESKDFKIPDFKDRYDFVLKFHEIV